MNINYQIIPAKEDYREIIHKGLKAYNLKACKFWGPDKYNPKPVDSYAINEENELIGGITADLVWEGLDIHRSWVHEKYRRKGIGSILLTGLEEYAVKNGMKCAQLITYDYQAFGFYAKHGYKEIGRMDDWPGKGHGNRGYISLAGHADGHSFSHIPGYHVQGKWPAQCVPAVLVNLFRRCR
jgi:ribosomal protein S18 acetylase RimI-like enzyme